jgi:hypothetical protein
MCSGSTLRSNATLNRSDNLRYREPVTLFMFLPSESLKNKLKWTRYQWQYTHSRSAVYKVALHYVKRTRNILYNVRGFLISSEHQFYTLLHWRRRSDWQFLYYNPNNTSLQSLTIISYAVMRLHNYNPYTFVTTITYYSYTFTLADFSAINYCLKLSHTSRVCLLSRPHS